MIPHLKAARMPSNNIIKNSPTKKKRPREIAKKEHFVAIMASFY